jgi:hypothetical protein
MRSDRRKKEHRMKRLAFAAVGAALIGLTACSHSTSPSASPTAQRAPVSCTQQYHNWVHGEGKGVMGALHDVSSAASAGNGQALTVALKHAKPTVAKAARHPIPACADPRGYWNVLLMHVHAAAASRGSASSVRAAMQDVPAVMDQLETDVKQTAQ